MFWKTSFKKKIGKRIVSVVLAVLLMAGTPGTEAAAGTVQAEKTEVSVQVSGQSAYQKAKEVSKASKKRGLVKEDGHFRYYKNGKCLRNTWREIDGRKYYFKANGNAARYSCEIKGKYYVFNRQGKLLNPPRTKIVEVGDRKFYVNKNGEPVKGWLVYQKKLYYVSKRGRCASNRTIDGITFTKNCWAKNNTNARLKMKVMDVIDHLTTPSMSREEKLRKCYYYTIGEDFHYNRAKWPNFAIKQWWKAAGLDMLTKKQGVCFGYACAFAALAKELGYTPYLIDSNLVAYGTRHCWVRIGGKYYDRLTGILNIAAYPHRYSVRQTIKF